MSIAKPEMIDWIRNNALALKTVNAGAGFEDLYPLRQWVGNARIVGLGDPSHYMSEPFKLTHRVFEFLVAELGFNLFLLEEPLAESLAASRYVLTGEGDALHSLASMSCLIWNCEEVSGIIEGMRRWNATHERKVYFYGCDAFTTAAPTMFLLQYLQRRDLGAYRHVRESLLPLACDVDVSNWVCRSDGERKRARAAISDVNKVLERLTADTTEDRYELSMARLHATVLDQAAEIWDCHRSEFSARHVFTIRDRSMAKNIASLLELHGPDAKAVILASTLHLQLREGRGYASTAPLGKHLRDRFGADFVMFGSGYDRGAMQDFYIGKGVGHDVMIPSSPGTVDAVLGEVGPPIFALDLRCVPKEVADGFAAVPGLRSFGERKSTGATAEYTMTQWPLDIRDYYDALLFVRETSPSHLRRNHTYMGELGREDRPAAEGLVNLDFMADLRHWRTLPQPSVGAYQATVVDEGGAAELEVARSESLWPWDVYVLWQAAFANPWRGKRIFVRCRASIDAMHDGSSAQLAIRTRSKGVVDPSEVFVWQRAFTWDAQTRELLVTAEIKDDADTITVALIMTGDGRARFGPVTITEEISG